MTHATQAKYPSLNWQKISENNVLSPTPPPHCLPQPEILASQTTPFFKVTPEVNEELSAQETDAEDAPLKEFVTPIALKQGLNELIDNSTALCAGNLSPSLLKTELKAVIDSLESQNKKNKWIQLKTQDGSILWVHLDFKNGKIGICGENLSNQPKYLHHYFDENGKVEQETLELFYTSYKVKSLNRFKDLDFEAKLKSLNLFQTGNEAIESLVGYLKAEKQTPPSPQKKLHLYTSVTTKILYGPKDPLPLIAAALTQRGNISSQEIGNVIERALFLKNLDLFTKKVTAFNLEGLKNEKKQKKAIYLSLLSKKLTFLATSLDKKKALKAKERQVVLAALKKFEELIEQVRPSALEEPDFHEEGAIPKPIVLEQDFLSSNLQSFDTQLESHESIQESSSIEISAAENTSEEVFQSEAKDEKLLKKSALLCKDPTTLKKGLKKLCRWAFSQRDKQASPHSVLKGIITSLPVFSHDSFKNIAAQDKKLAQDAINPLITLLNDFENILFASKVENSIDVDLEELKDLYLLSITLSGNLSFALLQSTLNNSETAYPLSHFIDFLQKGVYFKDPAAQKKAADLCKLFLPKESGELLTSLDAWLEKQKKEKEESAVDSKTFFYNFLASEVKTRLNAHGAGIKTLVKIAWQQASVKTEWIRALYRLSNKPYADFDNLKSASTTNKLKEKRFTKDKKSLLNLLKIAPKDEFIIEILKLIEDETSSEITFKNRVVAKPEFKKHHHFNAVKNLFSYHSEWIKAKNEYEETLSELKKVPYYKDIDFEQLEAEFNQCRNLFDCPTYESLKKKIENELNDLSRINDRFLIFKEMEWTNALYQQHNIKKVSCALEKLLKDMGLQFELPKAHPEPRLDELIQFHLLTEPYAAKEQLLDGIAISFNFAAKTANILENETKSAWKLIGECVSEEEILKKIIYKSENDFSFNSFVQDLLFKTDEKWKKRDTLPKHKRNKQIGFGAHPSSNALASSNNRTCYSDSNGDNAKLSSIQKELAEIGTQRKDEAWKAVCFIANHPLTLKDDITFRSLTAYLFDFYHIEHLADGEAIGLHTLISHQIPKKLNQAIACLYSKTKDPSVNEEDKKYAVQALANLSLLAIDFKNYLEKRNEECDEDKKINLEKYPNYYKACYDFFGPSLQEGVMPSYELSEFAEQLLLRTSLKAVEGNLEEKKAISYFLAAAEFNNFEHSFKPINNALNSLKKRREFAESILHYYFKVHGLSEIPEGLSYLASTQTLHYGEKSIKVFSCTIKAFETAVCSLGIRPPRGNWYLEDERFSKKIEKILGKPLIYFTVNGSNEIEGTPYSFNEQGEVFYTFKDGRCLKHVQDLPNPFSKCGLNEEFDPLLDHFFQDESSGKLWSIRHEEPRYWINDQMICRLKDNAVCWLEDGLPIWRHPNEDGHLEAYSIQQQDPPGEYRFIKVGDKVRLESLQHPGFFITKKLPFCHGVNLANFASSHVLLENNSGEKIMVCSFTSNDSNNHFTKRYIEYAISHGSIRTNNPWDLLLLIMRAEVPSLTLSHAKDIFLSPAKNDVEEEIQKELSKMAEDTKSKNFSSWLEWARLDNQTRGKNSAFSRLDLNGMSEVITAYLVSKAASKISQENQVSKEMERIFLKECQKWFSTQETQLQNEIKKIKNKKNSAPKANSNKKTDKKSKIFSLGDKIKAKLVQKSASSDLEEQLLALRTLYRHVFVPQVEEKLIELEGTSRKKKNENWKKFSIPLEKNGELLANAFSQRDSSSAKSQMIERLHEVEVGKDKSPKAIIKELKSFDELEELYEESKSKEDFVKEHLLDFYHLARTLKTKSTTKERLLKWLELTPSDYHVCLWLIDVTKKSCRYIKTEKLLNLEIKHKKPLREALELNKNQQLSFEEAKSNLSEFEEELKNTNRSWKTADDLNEIISQEFKKRKSFNKQIEKIKDEIEINSTEVKKLKKQYKSAIQNAMKKKRTWTIVYKIAKMIFAFVKVILLVKKANRPLKISNPYLIRNTNPLSPLPKQLPKPKTSPIHLIDQSFDAYFKQWKLALVEESNSEVEPLKPLPENGAIAKEVKDEIEEYRKLKKQPLYRLKSFSELLEFKASLKDEIAKSQLELKVRKSSLVQLSNQCPNASEQLKRLHAGKVLQWSDLLKLVHKKSELSYNKHLSDKTKADNIQNGVYACLALQSRIFQLYRLQSTLKEVEAEKDNESPFVQKLGEQLSETRGYDGSKTSDLNMLFFEAASPKGLYKIEQLEKLSEFELKGTELAQMPTGYGKTDYILVAINDLINNIDRVSFKTPTSKSPKKKNGTPSAFESTKKLVLNLWPNAISEINYGLSRSKTELATSGKVQQIKFSRDTHLDSAQLEYFLLRLERARQKGEAISVRASDVSSIFLHWIEKLEENHTNGSQETLKCLEFQAKILTLLFTSSYITIDEAHDILDPTQKTIYTLGKSLDVPEYAIDFSINVFNKLMENKGFASLIEKNETLTPEELDNSLAEIFSDATLQMLAKEIGIENIDLIEFRQFLSGESQHYNKWVVDENKLFLARGYYTIILKACLNGAVKTKFGLSKLHYDACKYAIPYEKQDVPKESRDSKLPSSYQNIDEILMKTLRVYHKEGLSKQNYLELIEKLLEEYDEENFSSKGKEIFERPSYKLLLKVFEEIGIDKSKILKLIEASKEARKVKALSLLDDRSVVASAKKPLLISLYVKKCIAPGIRIYPKSIEVTPQDLLGLFSNSLSVSATPQDALAHSLLTRFIKMSGASGKMFDSILLRTKKVQVMAENDSHDNYFIDEIAKACTERGTRAIADPCGLKKFDFSFVRRVGDKLNEINSPLHHIVYFDTAKSGFVRYNLKTKTSQPFHQEAHDPKNTLTLYDQARSTGTDIVQAPEAGLILLLSLASTDIQAGQGAGRMRQLDKRQWCEVWLTKPLPGECASKELEDEIFQLLDLLVKNGRAASALTNKSAFLQMMASELKCAMTRKMLGITPENLTDKKPLDSKAFVQQMVRYFEKFRAEFVIDSSYDPKLSYSGISKPVSGDKILEGSKRRIERKVDNYFSETEKTPIQQRLDAYSRNWKRVPLPLKDYGIDAGATQEVSAELEVSTMKSSEIDIELQTAVVSPFDNHEWRSKHEWPETVDAFNAMSFEEDSGFAAKLRLKKLKSKTNHERGNKANSEKNKLQSLIYQFSSYDTKQSVKFVSAKKAVQYQLEEAVSDGDIFFENNFLLSSNFAEQLGENSSPLLNSSNKKFLNHILLIWDGPEQNRKLTAIAVDDFDAKQIHLLFEKQRAKNADLGERKMALYSLDMNAVIDQGSNRFSPQELSSQQVAAVSAQGKLLAGKLRFTKNEKQYLKQKADRVPQAKSLDQKTHHTGRLLFSNLLKQFNPPDRQNDQTKFKYLLTA